MSSIKVAVRCRPFTLDDRLGVSMFQLSDEEGEINLLNSDYSTKRFAFSCVRSCLIRANRVVEPVRLSPTLLVMQWHFGAPIDPKLVSAFVHSTRE